jgi:transcriptional regulator
MYAREASREDRDETLHAAIREIRFGTLVVADDTGAPQAVHLPFVLKTQENTILRNTTLGNATLEGHVARANPIWKLLGQSRPALVMFQGPQAYVRPGWYPAKQEHGKVVPTWAYVSVHARGTPAIMEMDHLLRHVRELSDQEETGQTLPWSVDDAPEGFITALARGIVGLSIPIDSLEGVWKVNQHRDENDRLGMIDGLDRRGEADSAELATIMRRIEMEKSR